MCNIHTDNRCRSGLWVRSSGEQCETLEFFCDIVVGGWKESRSFGLEVEEWVLFVLGFCFCSKVLVWLLTNSILVHLCKKLTPGCLWIKRNSML